VQTEGATIWLETPHNSFLDADRAERLGEALREAAEFLKMANS
jgi:hypothetical protein